MAARAAHEAALAAESSARAEVDELRGRVRDAQRRAAEAASAAAAAGARAEALAAAVERADGIAPSLAELVRRGATLALALVEPEAGYELAVAAALERCAALACADDLASALALLEAAEAEGGALHVGRPGGTKAPAPPGAVSLEAHVRLAKRAPSELLAGVWLVDDAAALLRVTSGIAVTREGLGYDADRGVAFRSGASGEAALLRARRELEGAHAAAESERGAESALRESEAAQAAAELAALEASEAAHAEALAGARSALAAAERAEREAVADRERAARAAERAEHDRDEAERLGLELTAAIESAERDSAELARSAVAAAEAAARADAEHAELEAGAQRAGRARRAGPRRARRRRRARRARAPRARTARRRPRRRRAQRRAHARARRGAGTARRR